PKQRFDLGLRREPELPAESAVERGEIDTLAGRNHDDEITIVDLDHDRLHEPVSGDVRGLRRRAARPGPRMPQQLVSDRMAIEIIPQRSRHTHCRALHCADSARTGTVLSAAPPPRRSPELPQNVLELARRALERRMLVGPENHGQRLVVRAVDEERIAELLLRVEAGETNSDRNGHLLLSCEFHPCPPRPVLGLTRSKSHATRASADQPPASRSARTSSSLSILLRPGTPRAFARS